MFESTSGGQIKVFICCEPEKTMEELQQGTTPPWLKREDTRGQVLAMPMANDIRLQLYAAKIVSFYSR